MLVHSFQLSVRLVGADYRLLPLSLVWRGLGPTMFAVTLGYSVSEKVLFLRERCLLAEQETGVVDNRLNTDCLLRCELQWHSDSTAVMSHSQQHCGVI